MSAMCHHALGNEASVDCTFIKSTSVDFWKLNVKKTQENMENNEKYITADSSTRPMSQNKKTSCE